MQQAGRQAGTALPAVPAPTSSLAWKKAATTYTKVGSVLVPAVPRHHARVSVPEEQQGLNQFLHTDLRVTSAQDAPAGALLSGCMRYNHAAALHVLNIPNGETQS